MKSRSAISGLFAALVAMALGTVAHAADYPNRPVRIIVPYQPGGQADVAIRVIAQQFATLLGQPFVVLNSPGSGGVAAMSTMLNAPADGYTIAYADAGHWAINSALNPKLSYDPEKDFVPIGLFGETTGLFIAVTERLPVKTLQEMMALAKDKPGALTYGSAGVGSIHHLIMEDFKASAGLDILHIPYKGSTQTLPALLSGEISMAIASLGSVSNYVEQGKVRLLAVSTKKRSPLAPDVPTIAELAVPNFDHAGAEGLVARIGTPQEVIDTLSAALAKTVVVPEVQTRFIAFGLVPITDNSPKLMAETIRADREKYLRVVKISGATAE